MASTVEPCESKSLGPLSTTLEMFDTFKTSQDEDKDSDEESFHIPLLVCDDDSEIGKEVSSGMGTPCDETEDDILNKFDENEDENISKINETKDTDSNLDKNADIVNDLEQADRDSCEDMGFHDLEVVDEINDDTHNGTSQNSLDKDEVENENIEIETNTTENKTDEVLNKEQIQEDQILETDENIASEEKVLEKNDLEESSSKIIKDEADVIDESTPMEKDEKILENDTETNEEIMQETVQKNTDKLEENQNDRDTVEVDHHNDAQVDNTVQEEKLSKEENKTPNIQLEKEQDLKNILVEDETEITDEEKIEAENKSPKELTLVNIENVDNKTENILINIEENISKSSEENNEKLIEENNEKLVEENELESESNEESSKSSDKEIDEEKKEVESTAMDIDDPDTLEGNSELKKPEEKLNSDIKINEKDEDTEKDLACDDLLDISVIRDVDEDDACAIAAEITETHSSEKSDSDEQESKQETETDDMELEQEDSQASTEREEAMEYDDNTNSCDQDNTTDNVISDNTSDGESKENESAQNKSKSPEVPVDISDSDSNQSTPEAENEKVKDVPEKPLDSDNSVKPEEDLTASKSQDEVPSKPDEESAEKQKENVGPQNKRPLSQSEEEEEVAVLKKMRLDEKSEKSNKLEEDKKSSSVKNEKTKTLMNFEQFMKKRNLGEGKLTRSDLEQFCLQKICEAIMHRTEVGELHQTIKKQENIIESLRKDLAQLTKQTRDLDIVNKKLMNELRNQNGSHKPLVPLKITRSVGLQVKLTVGTEQVNRRRSYTTNTPRTPTNPNNTPNRNRPVPQGNNVVRQVAPVAPAANSPRKPQAPAPILSQALQTRPTPPVTKSPAPANKQRPVPIRPKAADSAKPPANKPSAPGVIDLTDEDDKTAKIAANIVTQKNVGIFNKNVKILQKTPVAKTNNTSPKTAVKPAGVPTKVGMQPRAMTGLPQGVRLTATQMKNGITIPASVVTSNAQGTTQLMYVVQPGSLVNTTAGGGQKAVLLNFQPTNGVLTSTINGSTVSVIPSKTTNSMQLKPMAPRKHPAPLPLPPPTIINNSLKKLLPKPHLSIKKTETGIILQWRMPYNLDEYEGIASYQLFAYQETNAPPSSDMWRKVGDVKALALPMACTLTQFADKNKYYFAVRSVDVHKRIGAFSDPEEISL